MEDDVRARVGFHENNILPLMSIVRSCDYIPSDTSSFYFYFFLQMVRRY